MNQAAETRLANLRASPRCGARNRAGRPCDCPAVRGRARCRLHGGLSHGAPKGRANGKYKDGYFTAEAVAERRWAKSLAAGFAEIGKDG
ncbi:HGGxSTG domain-containing protein [Bradyrhizobium barranii]|uniref:HGGxSTG domain-containing protein n=1 Tax=Bradyrhizobium barranii TaxID=2992140 RepID=UPI002AAFAEE0|nr:HGGxSTG domain-containing protein [Bradyrhizobium barranii]